MSNGSLELGGPGLISPVLPQVMQHLFQRWMFGSITQFVPQINALTSPCPIDLVMRGSFISCIKGFPHSHSSNVEYSPGYYQFWIIIKVPVCYHSYHAFSWFSLILLLSSVCWLNMKLFGRCLLLLLHLEMTQWEANNFVSITLSLTFPVCPEATVEDKIYVFFFFSLYFLPYVGKFFLGRQWRLS